MKTSQLEMNYDIFYRQDREVCFHQYSFWREFLPLNRYKAVFFDVGGTLLKPHPSVGHIYAEHARPFGFDGTAEELDLRFGRAWKKQGGMESLGKKSGQEVERKFWYDMVFEVFQETGGLRDFDQYFDRIYVAFMSEKNWKVFDDVLESGVLEKLRERGVILGVISNWDSRLKGILENTGLARYFDFILASTVVGSAKPDQIIFQTALKCSGVDPKDACHIGDEPKADVQGALNSGMDAILIDRHGRYPEETSKTISSFQELV